MFCLFQKRRSERNTNKRKKYLDDIDLNLSEEEKPEAEPEGDGPVVKPVCFRTYNILLRENKGVRYN